MRNENRYARFPTPDPGRRRGRLRAARRSGVLGIVAAALLVLPLSGAARADEEESTQAPMLVAQAIALIANDAGDERVAERIQDALDAPEKEGADLAKVRQALDLIDRPGEDRAVTGQARVLLLAAIGGKLPAEESADGSPGYATGSETGTSVILDEFKPAWGVSDGGDAVLLALAIAAIVGGLVLSRRLRPPHRMRELKRRTVAEETR